MDMTLVCNENWYYGNSEKNKTEIRIQDAFLNIITETPYNKITIDTIIKKAGISRSTFYRYFSSKDDLLRKLEKEHFEGLANILRPLEKSDWHLNNEEYQSVVEILKVILDFYLKYKHFSVFLFETKGDPFFIRTYRIFIYKLLKKSYSNNDSDFTLKKYCWKFAIGGLLTVFTEWIKNQDINTADMADFLLKVVISICVCTESDPRT